MKKSYRLAQEAAYAAALKTVKVTVKKVTAHKDGSASIPATEKVVAAVKRIPGVIVISAGDGEIRFTVPAAVEYHAANPPLFTEAEKAADAEAKAARKAERLAKRSAAEVAVEDEDEPETAQDEDSGEEEAPEVPENGI